MKNMKSNKTVITILMIRTKKVKVERGKKEKKVFFSVPQPEGTKKIKKILINDKTHLMKINLKAWQI